MAATDSIRRVCLPVSLLGALVLVLIFQIDLAQMQSLNASATRLDLLIVNGNVVGNYGEQGYEEWLWEVVFGDETFSDELEENGSIMFDTFRDRERRQEEARDKADRNDKDKEEEEETTEPYEKVRIRVSFPKLGEFPNTLTLERWMPWEDVYGPEAAEDGETPAAPSEP